MKTYIFYAELVISGAGADTIFSGKRFRLEFEAKNYPEADAIFFAIAPGAIINSYEEGEPQDVGYVPEID